MEIIKNYDHNLVKRAKKEYKDTKNDTKRFNKQRKAVIGRIVSKMGQSKFDVTLKSL